MASSARQRLRPVLRLEHAVAEVAQHLATSIRTTASSSTTSTVPPLGRASRPAAARERLGLGRRLRAWRGR